MIESKFSQLYTRCHKGGGGSPPDPPLPPAPTQAADNVRKDKMYRRRVNAKGYASTILTEGLTGGLGAGIGPGQEYARPMKTLLGS